MESECIPPWSLPQSSECNNKSHCIDSLWSRLEAPTSGATGKIALWILGVKYFLFIGVFAGLANFIPYFGPIVGAALAVLVSLLNNGNFETVFYVLLAFAAVKLIDDVAVQPYVVGKSVHMHPMMFCW